VKTDRDVTIPAGMARMFTTNLPALDIFPTPGNDEQKAALERRIQVVNVTAKLYVDMDGVDSPWKRRSITIKTKKYLYM